MTGCDCEKCLAIVPPPNPCPKCENPRLVSGDNNWAHDRSAYVHGNAKTREDIIWIHRFEACQTEIEAAELLLGGPVEKLGEYWYLESYVRELEAEGFFEPVREETR